jgi:hypothetical protein
MTETALERSQVCAKRAAHPGRIRFVRLCGGVSASGIQTSDWRCAHAVGIAEGRSCRRVLIQDAGWAGRQHPMGSNESLLRRAIRHAAPFCAR